MTSTKEAHPPARTSAMVSTGASKLEIASPAKRADWIFESVTHEKRARQFEIATRPLSPGKRTKRISGRADDHANRRRRGFSHARSANSRSRSLCHPQFHVVEIKR